MKEPIFEYNSNKNLKLLEERGIGFEDIIAILNTRGALAVIKHPNIKKYPDQKIYIIDVAGYAYLIRFERRGNKVLLKTIFPSRKATKQFSKKVINEVLIHD